jgi:hypothetical protein
MRTTDLRFTDAEAFVRTRFEALYDHLEQVEHLIDLGVLAIDDVETAFRYYMVRDIRPTIQHFAFLDYYDYPRARKFLLRFGGKEKFKRDKAFPCREPPLCWAVGVRENLLATLAVVGRRRRFYARFYTLARNSGSGEAS